MDDETIISDSNEKTTIADEVSNEPQIISTDDIKSYDTEDIAPSKKKIKFSVKLKLIILTSLLVTGVTFFISFYLLNKIKKNLLSDMELRANLFTENLAHGIGEIFDDDTSRHEIIHKNKLTLKDIEKIYVINLKNELIDTTDEIKFEKIIQSKFNDKIDKIHIEIGNDIIKHLKNQNFYKSLYMENNINKISYICPVKIETTTIGYVKIAFTQKYIYDKISKEQITILLFVLIALILGIILSYILSSHIIKPIFKLSHGVHIIGTGNLNHKIKINTNDELKYLADEFNSMTDKLIQAQKSMVEHERNEEQLQIARQIQQNLLPEQFPDLPEIEISSYYNPARAVGGDYYDIIYQPSTNKLSAIIADVSGKGVPAALVMVMIRTVLHSTLKFIKSANEAIENINTGITGRLTGDKFATMIYFNYNIKTGDLEYSNAAHSPLFVFKKKSNTILELDTEGVPVGIEMNSKFGVATTVLDEGDIVITFTDGITEAMNKNNEMFKSVRLKEIIKANHQLSAQQLKEKIIETIMVFVGDAPQHDDITLVIFKINNVPEISNKKIYDDRDRIKTAVINPADHNSLII